MERQNFVSGTPWEPVVGYSRAVRVGNVVHVRGRPRPMPTGQVVGPATPTPRRSRRSEHPARPGARGARSRTWCARACT